MADMIFWPFPTDTVSEWPGTRPAGWAYHVGTDFAVPQGTPLRATISGRVDIHWSDGLGAWVIDIIAPSGTVIRNGHMSYMAVKDGQWVNAGDYIGNTGGAPGTPGAGLSTGSHLHWEIRSNQNWSGPGWYDPRNLTIYTFDSQAGGELPAATTSGDEEMKMIHRTIGGQVHYALFTTNFWLVFTGEAAATRFLNQGGGGASWPATKDFWDACKQAATKGSYDVTKG